MKREFSKWLLEVAKYVATILILSTVLVDKKFGLLYYLLCIIGVAVLILIGLFLLRSSERDERNLEKEKEKRQREAERKNINNNIIINKIWKRYL